MIDSIEKVYEPSFTSGSMQLQDESVLQQLLNRELLDDDLDYQPYFDSSDWQDSELMELLGEADLAAEGDWADSYRH